VNYFELHIGDYEKATAHLTACEDGIYGRLMRRYYDTEAPLPDDLKALQRFVRARSRDEKEAVQTVLDEFFQLEADGWHHKRCDEEIARYSTKREKARRSAEVRWSHQERNANAYAEDMRTHCEGNALQTPDTSNKSDREKCATPAGEAGRAMRSGGCTSVNLSHPDFQAALRENVSLEELTDAVIASAGMGISGAGLFAYAVKVARTNHAKTATTVIAPQPRAGPQPIQGKTMTAIMALEGMKNGLDQTRITDGLPEATHARLGTTAGS